jgi:peroxiredoxin
LLTGENVIIQLTVAVILTLFSQPAPNNLVGKKAIEFTLSDVNGEEVALQSFRGKVVLLNFWATWCGPCREELLDRMQEKFRQRGLAIVAVTVDNELENVRGFLKKYDLKLQALWDRRKKVADAYKVEKMPSSYLIDRNGVIRFVHRGYSPEELKRIEAEIDELLGKPQKTVKSDLYGKLLKRLERRFVQVRLVHALDSECTLNGAGTFAGKAEASRSILGR